MSELTARSRSRSPPAGADVNLKCAECLDAHVETGSAFEKFSKNKKARVLLPQKTIIRHDDGSAFAFRAVSPPLDEVFIFGGPGPGPASRRRRARRSRRRLRV